MKIFLFFQILALTVVSVYSVNSMFILDDGDEYRNYHETGKNQTFCTFLNFVTIKYNFIAI